MLVKDKELSIFQTLNQSHQLVLFELVTPQHLDITYNQLYSNRTIQPFLEEKTNVELAIYIDTLFGKKWDDILNVNTELWALQKSGTTVTDTEEHTDRAYTRITETQDSAYNTGAYYNTEKVTETYTPDSTNNDVIEKTRITKSPQLLQYLYNHLQNDIIRNIIFRDINSILTLKIHYQEV